MHFFRIKHLLPPWPKRRVTDTASPKGGIGVSQSVQLTNYVKVLTGVLEKVCILRLKF